MCLCWHFKAQLGFSSCELFISFPPSWILLSGYMWVPGCPCLESQIATLFTPTRSYTQTDGLVLMALPCPFLSLCDSLNINFVIWASFLCDLLALNIIERSLEASCKHNNYPVSPPGSPTGYNCCKQYCHHNCSQGYTLATSSLHPTRNAMTRQLALQSSPITCEAEFPLSIKGSTLYRIHWNDPARLTCTQFSWAFSPPQLLLVSPHKNHEVCTTATAFTTLHQVFLHHDMRMMTPKWAKHGKQIWKHKCDLYTRVECGAWGAEDKLVRVCNAIN